MKADRYFEGVYELLEQFDFKELSEKDRIFVLSEMTENEYNNMRSTLKDTESFFSNSSEPGINDSLLNSIIRTDHKPNILIKILNKPVKFYQLAASIILLLGLFAIKQYSDIPDKNSALPSSDTIYIQKTDTVYSKLADSIRILKNKIIYISSEKDNNKQVKLLSVAADEFDSGEVISPSSIYRIKELAFENNFSRDTSFKN